MVVAGGTIAAKEIHMSYTFADRQLFGPPGAPTVVVTTNVTPSMDEESTQECQLEVGKPTSSSCRHCANAIEWDIFKQNHDTYITLG